ncbi:MAG: alpha/beta hydrolase [Chloroflexi bacterium]|nr:MAG: alpha/beta hydrolase [Chloroflexota bacterium]
MIAMTKPMQTSLLATELRKMKSKATGKNYQISIALPYTYVDDSIKIGPFEKSLTAWPVVYVLDSNWFFGMITDMVRVMPWCGGRTTDAIIVGVGYPEEESLRETWRKVVALRTHDLTPMQSETSEKYNSEWVKLEVKTGGGSEFFKFIKQELIPLIDREYRTDPAKRILAGHSHGGLFTVFAMFQEPGLFSSYIASSPSLNFAEKFMFTIESEYAIKHKRLPAQIYLSAGELEEGTEDTTLTDMYRFAALLESRKYKGFSLTKQVFLDNNHCEVTAPAFQAGLKLALKK